MGLEWAFSGASRSQRRIRGETRKWRERCGSSGKAPLRPSKKNLPLRARRKLRESRKRRQRVFPTLAKVRKPPQRSLRVLLASSAVQGLLLVGREKHAGDLPNREGDGRADQHPPCPRHSRAEPEIEFDREATQHSDDCTRLICSPREDSEKKYS